MLGSDLNKSRKTVPVITWTVMTDPQFSPDGGGARSLPSSTCIDVYMCQHRCGPGPGPGRCEHSCCKQGRQRKWTAVTGPGTEIQRILIKK